MDVELLLLLRIYSNIPFGLLKSVLKKEEYPHMKTLITADIIRRRYHLLGENEWLSREIYTVCHH